MAAVTSKSAMTPWRSGRIARIVAGVRPIIFRASSPTACTRPLNSSIATTDGSKTTMPRPRTNTKVFAVPRSIANSRPARIQLTPKTPTEPTLAGARPKGSAGPGVGPALRSHSAGACDVDVSHRDGARMSSGRYSASTRHPACRRNRRRRFVLGRRLALTAHDVGGAPGGRDLVVIAFEGAVTGERVVPGIRRRLVHLQRRRPGRAAVERRLVIGVDHRRVERALAGL